MSSFKRRWFVLAEGELRYSVAPGDAAPRGAIRLADVTRVTATAASAWKWKEPGLQVDTVAGRAYLLKCAGADERDAWLAAIEGARQIPG